MKVGFCCWRATRSTTALSFRVPSLWFCLCGVLVNKPDIKNFQGHPWPTVHLSYCELFAAWPKDGNILNLGFLIYETELMARG